MFRKEIPEMLLKLSRCTCYFTLLTALIGWESTAVSLLFLFQLLGRCSVQVIMIAIGWTGNPNCSLVRATNIMSIVNK